MWVWVICGVVREGTLGGGGGNKKVLVVEGGDVRDGRGVV